MKVILLAAGKSSRFNPISNYIPKQLICANKGEPIIQSTLDLLQKLNRCISISLDKVILVTGYKSKLIKNYVDLYSKVPVEHVFNEKYSEMNSCRSFALALPFLDFNLEDTLVLDTDVIWSEDAAERLVNIINLISSQELKNEIILISNYFDSSKCLNPKRKETEIIFSCKKEDNGETSGLGIVSKIVDGGCTKGYMTSGITYFPTKESGINYINSFIDRKSDNEYWEDSIFRLVQNEEVLVKPVADKPLSEEYDSIIDVPNWNEVVEMTKSKFSDVFKYVNN